MNSLSLGSVRRLILACALPLTLVLSMVAQVGQAEARTKLPHWKTSNGYECHKHSKAKRMRHKGTVWPKRGTKSRTHCIKIKHKRHRSHGSSAWVLPRYVVMCESGGNPRVVNRTAAGAANGYPAGLYQIIGPTWRAYGGTRFAPTADRASVYEQGIIAKRILRAQGPRAWACW